ncbi:MAG: hypothetical protein QOK42_431 [Frankiaceae bacterium]|jgi:hypothetical protein|nr:hypothetical protein [Frankiaceae bacterium]MDX6224498.1 hypothetical protein [Frankiales bacterium]MDX6274730.1 hypothetical protein [Frankiales bacterium]
MPHLNSIRAFGVGLAVTGALALAPAAFADEPSPCDAYSQTCAPQPTTSVKGEESEKPTPTTSVKGVKETRGGTTLPFTGGQLAMLLTVGAAGVGAGTVLTAAGRKRRHSA